MGADVGLTGRSIMANGTCTHLDQIAVTALPEPIEGCEDCLVIGSRWVHLRMCMICGKIGCCDSSPNRHATRHARESGHPIARSAEPGEAWAWCFVDEIGVDFDPGADQSAAT
jgi:uncharacterized UBP type Zn finger protein